MSKRNGKGWFPADRKRLTLSFVLMLLLVATVAVGLYALGRRAELSAGGEAAVRGDLSGRFKEPRIIVYDGRNYRYRDDLTAVLFMGVDRTTEENATVSGFRNGGQADFLLLTLIDPKKETVASIQIDRDTMAEITILGVLGSPAGTRNAQICLSHGFGDGGEQSSQFTVDAVSKLLYGVDIDFFVAVNLDGISALNEALGGVTVTLVDDFTRLDPAMRPGETLTLRGNQAEYYVRSRMGIGEGTNESRMVRQKEYLTKAGVLLDEKLHENASFAGMLFDALKGNLTTNMSRGRMINEAYASRDYFRQETISLPGEHTIGDDGFVEFHADESALEKLVLDAFFEPADAS